MVNYVLRIKVVLQQNKALPKKFYFFIKMVAQCTKLMDNRCKSDMKSCPTATVEAGLFLRVHARGLRLLLTPIFLNG